MENVTEDVQWVMDLFHGEPSPYAILYAGYALLALMVVACVKEGVFWKRAHDVFLLLFFACVMDMIEMRSKYFLFTNRITPTAEGVKFRWWQLLWWLLVNHFTYSFVEAIVSIYRFVTRTLGKAMPICFVYISLGLYFGLQAFFFYYAFGKSDEFGKSETLITPFVPVRDDLPFVIRVLDLINTIIFLGSMPIAPILSLIMLFKEKKSPVEKNEWSVAAFNIPSSFSTLFLVYFTWWVLAIPHERLSPEYRDLVKVAYLFSFLFQYFRFLVLCVCAIVLVGDIRRAVLSFLLRPSEKPKEHSIIPQTVINKNYIDDNNLN